MVKLRTLIEQIGSEGQYFDIGDIFSRFNQSLDVSVDELKKKFQTQINQALRGKRVIANASRGYKQYQKHYEFDVNEVTIEDRYGNYVVIAHDATSSKPKEYYLSTKSKIKILGPSTGQPSPQKGVNPAQVKNATDNIPPSKNSNPNNPVNDINNNQPQTSAKPVQPPPSNISEEDDNNAYGKQYDAYSIDSIVDDVKPWLPLLLKKKETPLVDFVKKIGWTDRKEHGVIVSIFELKLPINELRFSLDRNGLQNLFYNKAPTLKLAGLEEDKKNGLWNIKIKKVYREN